MVKNNRSIRDLIRIDHLANNDPEGAYWTNLGYVKTYRKRTNEDMTNYLLEALTGRTQTQEATAAIVAEPTVQSTAETPTSKPLPPGYVKKMDEDGHWSYHSAPVGDIIPEAAEEIDHHCRVCNTEGTADTEQNAKFASVLARVKYGPGAYTCHGFSCINAGSLLQKNDGRSIRQVPERRRKRRNK